MSSNHWSGAKGPRIQHLLAPHGTLRSVGASGVGRSLPLRVRGGFTQASLDSSPAVLMLRGIFRKELFLLVPRLWAFFEHLPPTGFANAFFPMLHGVNITLALLFSCPFH